MADPTLPELIEKLRQDINALDVVLLGDPNATITLNGVTKPSISKAVTDRLNGYRTVSTSAPTGIPRDGEEWIVVGS
ncbi:putative glutamine-hydrolyzing GMP synthase subunit [Vibrio phage pVco-14]|nr:putative glutamine-hydrolyzing GMP synthase subunit [Vibrio phage pVco-14]